MQNFSIPRTPFHLYATQTPRSSGDYDFQCHALWQHCCASCCILVCNKGYLLSLALLRGLPSPLRSLTIPIGSRSLHFSVLLSATLALWMRLHQFPRRLNTSTTTFVDDTATQLPARRCTSLLVSHQKVSGVLNLLLRETFSVIQNIRDNSAMQLGTFLHWLGNYSHEIYSCMSSTFRAFYCYGKLTVSCSFPIAPSVSSEWFSKE